MVKANHALSNSAQVAEMSVTVNNSPILYYDHLDDHAYLWNDSWVRTFHKMRDVLLTVHMAFLYMPSYIKPIIILASLFLKMQIHN